LREFSRKFAEKEKITLTPSTPFYEALSGQRKEVQNCSKLQIFKMGAT
jgi:hypothetical protein